MLIALKLDNTRNSWYNYISLKDEKVIILANVSNKAIVDKSIDILGSLYQDILKKHKLIDGVDFSGLSEEIMSALEQGRTEQVNSIIDKFVDGKIKRYDIVAGERDIKRGAAKQHRRAVDDLIGFSKKYNRMCTEAILNNVKVEKKQELSFRESLSNFQSEDREQENNVSIEEALQKNAQQLYERTGEVPNGYALGEDGQVYRDRNEKQREDVKEVLKYDAEMEK